MNFLLCAAERVGLDVAKIFREAAQPVATLVLDVQDRCKVNREIVAACADDRTLILDSNQFKEAATIECLKQHQIDMGILAWWPYIIRRPHIELARRGFLNFHPSLLPICRGKDPNFWSLKEGLPFGVTIHFVDDRVDTGDIAFQAKIETSWEDTGETLYRKALVEIVQLFRTNFDQIRFGQIPRIPQSAENATFHCRSDLDEGSQVVLDHKYQARDLLNVLRARTFHQHPAAWFVEDGQRYEIRVSINKVPFKESLHGRVRSA